MTIKETVLDAIQHLPADATYEQVMEEVATLAAIERGQQAAREGRVTSHQDFERQAQQWTLK